MLRIEHLLRQLRHGQRAVLLGATRRERSESVPMLHLTQLSNYLTNFWQFSNLEPKFSRARSPPYRSLISQPNARWKALDEIYQIYIPSHRSNLKISANFRHKMLWLDLTV